MNSIDKGNCLNPRLFFSNSAIKAYSFSPREVSLKEGDLPKLPQEDRKTIEKYLEGEWELPDITKDNYKQMLLAVKIVDLERDRKFHRKEHKNSSYELRNLCLLASQGQLTTFEAFTKSINSKKYFDNPFCSEAIAYGMKEENWVPERVRLHGSLIQSYAINSLNLSRKLELNEPVTIALRGNSGSGKSRVVRKDSFFHKGVDEIGEVSGVLCPDAVKFLLRRGISGVTNRQVHIEGSSVLATKTADELQKKAAKASFIMDETFRSIEMVHSLLSIGKDIVMKDLDVPLMLSCLRILGRDINSEPCVPFDPIANGFKQRRENQKALLELVVKQEKFKVYELIVTDHKGNQGIAAEKRAGEFFIRDNTLFERANNAQVNEEIEQVRKAVITEELIEAYKSQGIKPDAVAQHLGKTVEQALGDFSLILPNWLSVSKPEKK